MRGGELHWRSRCPCVQCRLVSDNVQPIWMMHHAFKIILMVDLFSLLSYLYGSNFKSARYFVTNPIYINSLVKRKIPTTPHGIILFWQHNIMISKCYCLGSSALRERAAISNIWVYQQVGNCTDDVVMWYMA